MKKILIVGDSHAGAVKLGIDILTSENNLNFEVDFCAVGSRYGMFESLEIKNSTNFPMGFAVYQNFPNPFNPVTTLFYELPKEGSVEISIHDMVGRLVKSLSIENQSAGYNSMKWDATNNDGQLVSAGLYIYTISTGYLKQSRKMLFLK